MGTRARLLAGTLRCLRGRGIAGTSSRDIAAESGVNLAGITYHFGSKDELVAQALLDALRRWLGPAIERLRAGGDPVESMRAAVVALQASLDDARDLLPIYLEALVHASRDDALGRRVRDLLAELRAFLAERIEELRSAGVLPGWVEPPHMAALLVAAGDGLALHAAVEPEALDRDAVARQVVGLLLSAGAGAAGRGS